MSRPYSPEELAHAFKLKDEGFPVRAIAQRMGRDRRGVAVLLKRGPTWQPTYRVGGWPGKPGGRHRK